MIKLKTKELHFDEELKKKIEFICDFCNTKPTIINGSIKNIEHTNLNYIGKNLLKLEGKKDVGRERRLAWYMHIMT